MTTQVEFQDRRQYLTAWLELALVQRQSRRAQRLTKQAGFPTVKTLEGYNFGPVTSSRDGAG